MKKINSCLWLQSGLWLAYIQFEKCHGDPVLVGGLVTKAEDELEVNEAQIFRELLMVVRELQGEVIVIFHELEGFLWISELILLVDWP